MSSSSFLYLQCFGRYDLQPSSDVPCRTREPTQNLELNSLSNPIYMLPQTDRALEWGMAGCHLHEKSKALHMNWALWKSMAYFFKYIHVKIFFGVNDESSGEWYPTEFTSVGFRSQIQASRVSSHTEELWYNERVCLWMTIYIYIYILKRHC